MPVAGPTASLWASSDSVTGADGSMMGQHRGAGRRWACGQGCCDKPHPLDLVYLGCEYSAVLGVVRMEGWVRSYLPLLYSMDQVLESATLSGVP